MIFQTLSSNACATGRVEKHGPLVERSAAAFKSFEGLTAGWHRWGRGESAAFGGVTRHHLFMGVGE